MDEAKRAAEAAAARKIEAQAEQMLEERRRTHARDKIIGTLTGTLGQREEEMRKLQDLRDAARRRAEELGG